PEGGVLWAEGRTSAAVRADGCGCTHEAIVPHMGNGARGWAESAEERPMRGRLPVSDHPYGCDDTSSDTGAADARRLRLLRGPALAGRRRPAADLRRPRLRMGLPLLPAGDGPDRVAGRARGTRAHAGDPVAADRAAPDRPGPGHLVGHLLPGVAVRR